LRAPNLVRLESLLHFWSWGPPWAAAEEADLGMWRLCVTSSCHLLGILEWEVAGVRVSL